MPMQNIAIFHGCKNGNFSVEKCFIFLIFAQNIDCGYTLGPPRLGVLTSTHYQYFTANKKIMYTSVNPIFPT